MTTIALQRDTTAPARSNTGPALKRLWATSRSSPVSVHGWVALTLRIVLTTALGVALMALVFYSDRSGRDESTGGGGHKPDRNRDDLGSRP